MSIAAIILQVILGLIFILAAATKLSGSKMQVDAFGKRYHYPQWFRVFIGACELAGGIALIAGIWLPVLGLLAAAGLAVIMAGGTYTHLIRDTQGRSAAIGTAVLFVLAAAVFVLDVSAATT